jgi:hypothetical protein
MRVEKDTETRKKSFSLKMQFTLFFILFVMALYSVVIITTLQQLKGITETISAQLGLPIVEETAAIIDGDAFENLSKTLDPQDPYYEKTRLQLLAIKEASNCLYLYTMTPASSSAADKVYRYIIDGSTSPDDTEHFSPLGTEEDISHYQQPILKTMETKTTQVSSIDYNPPWGWTVSTYAPILNSSGKSVGIIGCDFRAENIYEKLWSQIIRQLVVSAFFVILGFAAYLYMVNGVNKQNRRLIELKEAAEESSAALKEERDTISAMKDALKVGLFFMDKNFIIQDHYSRFLESVLDVKDLRGKKFTDLLSASMSPKEITSLMEYFVILFNHALIRNKGFNKQLMEKLNPIQELTYISPETGKEKRLQWTFVPVDRGNGRLFILGNIQDITAEKHLETQLVKEEIKSREEINTLFKLIRSEPNIIKELERVKQERTAFSGLIDKILILKEENYTPEI